MVEEIKKITLEIAKASMKEYYVPVRNENPSPIVVGGLYMIVIDNKLLFFTIIRQLFNDWYEVFLTHPYPELTRSQFIVSDFMDIEYSIEPHINFYLKREEIEEYSCLIETIPYVILSNLLKERESDKEQEVDKYTNELENMYLEILKPYHLRIFQILDELEDMEE